MAVFDQVRAILSSPPSSQEYSPLNPNSEHDHNEPPEDQDSETLHTTQDDPPFSWFIYSIFFIIGVAMLWAWNMYLAASPYFSNRFASDEWIQSHFQSAIISAGTTPNLLSMLILAKLQANASYTKRIAAALGIDAVLFLSLALSTSYFLDVSAGVYLGFLLSTVCITSIATGMMQNGAFALAAGFGNPAYTQAIMAGQGLAGVLPPIAQIVSVLAIPPRERYHGGSENVGRDPGTNAPPPQESSTAALIYFLTATGVCVIALLAFIPLARRHNQILESRMTDSIPTISESGHERRKSIPLLALYKKLHWLAAAVFSCFVITMFYPVFTSQILSTHNLDTSARIFQPATFIPLAFLLWNTGDLLGRLISPFLPHIMTRRPALMFLASIARLGFLPLYLLCNIRGRGAVVQSDLFYLIVVQFGFGLSNGVLGSGSMMAAVESVEEAEREAAGGFMGLNLVGGLAAGSLLSFLAASV